MIVLRNAVVVDGSRKELPPPVDVVIEGDSIREVNERGAKTGADEIDLSGKILMPGLIDCHVHVVAGMVNLGQNALLPASLVAARAAGIMRCMLMRGFTPCAMSAAPTSA